MFNILTYKVLRRGRNSARWRIRGLPAAHGRADGRAFEQAHGRADGRAIDQAHGRAAGRAIDPEIEQRAAVKGSADQETRPSPKPFPSG